MNGSETGSHAESPPTSRWPKDRQRECFNIEGSTNAGRASVEIEGYGFNM